MTLNFPFQKTFLLDQTSGKVLAECFGRFINYVYRIKVPGKDCGNTDISYSRYSKSLPYSQRKVTKKSLVQL